MWETIGLGIFLFILIGLVCLLLWGALTDPPSYTPMSYDEEYNWLRKDHGLSHEEATEIAEAPWRM